MSEQKTHAEIIAEVRFHAQQNIDAEKGSPTFGILTMEGKIAKDYADRLEAAHKREIDAAAKREHLWRAGEAEVSFRSPVPDGAETLADIVNEIRARAGAWPDEKLKQYDLRLADRIEEAARREATKLIPAKNIKFYDGYGRRQVSYGWVKVGNESLASHQIVQQDVFAGKVHGCAFCVADCPLRGNDVMVICERFKKSEVSV